MDTPKIPPPENFKLLVFPDELPPAAPYAQTSFVYLSSPADVTILFLRAPLLDDPAIEKISKTVKDGAAKVVGHVVSSVTMSRATALDMAQKLIKDMADQEEAAAKAKGIPK